VRPGHRRGRPSPPHPGLRPAPAGAVGGARHPAPARGPPPRSGSLGAVHRRGNFGGGDAGAWLGADRRPPNGSHRLKPVHASRTEPPHGMGYGMQAHGLAPGSPWPPPAMGHPNAGPWARALQARGPGRQGGPPCAADLGSMGLGGALPRASHTPIRARLTARAQRPPSAADSGPAVRRYGRCVDFRTHASPEVDATTAPIGPGGTPLLPAYTPALCRRASWGLLARCRRGGRTLRRGRRSGARAPVGRPRRARHGRGPGRGVAGLAPTASSYVLGRRRGPLPRPFGRDRASSQLRFQSVWDCSMKLTVRSSGRPRSPGRLSP
jgi:hypothetical protein